MSESMNTERFKTIEEAGISIREAGPEDLPLLDRFLSRADIDSLFVPALSDSARGITISERVIKKHRDGTWIMSVYNGEAVGCMAVIPSKLSFDVPPVDPSHGVEISVGVPFTDWGVNQIIELSTVVTDRALRDTLKVKGVGAELLEKTKEWTKRYGKGNAGFVTDSWVGGDMGGFVDAMNAKAYDAWLRTNKKTGYPASLDTLVRLYSDPSKRGVDGPPTVVYGIPIEDRDWEFFAKNQEEIRKVRELYNSLNKN